MIWKQFDPGKPFYSLVINYLVQLAGIKEMALRGAHLHLGIERRPVSAEDLPVDMRDDEDASAHVLSAFRDVEGDLQLLSVGRSGTVDVPIGDLAALFALQSSTHMNAQSILCAMGLLCLAHDMNKNNKKIARGELWYFLSQCRNAAAHGGRFHFKKGQPAGLARWSGLQIHSGLQGTNLFRSGGKGQSGGLIGIGDPILLLLDIEKTSTSMRR